MNHHGMIPIWSQPPALAAARLAAEPRGERPSCPGAGVGGATGTSPAVLIVDDEPVLADAVRGYLVRRGYDVDLAGSGEDALARMRQCERDLVVLDYGLPGMDGLEALRRLKQLSPGAEVVMVSAHGTAETAEEAMRLGAFSYLSKPVDLVELGVVLDEAWTRTSRAREAGLSPDGDVN
jgi:DNA-binding NtrC family response regulator